MTRFMTLDFADGDRSALLARVAAMAPGRARKATMAKPRWSKWRRRAGRIPSTSVPAEYRS